MSRQPILTLPKWVTALSNVASAKATLVCIGSSTTAGYNASAAGRRFEGLLDYKLRLRNELTSEYHEHISLAADSARFSYTGTHSTEAKGLALSTEALSQSATMSLTASGRYFTIYYVEGSGSLPFDVSIDGGSATTITPNTSLGADTHTGSRTLDATTNTSHDIVITATNACKISGVMTHTNHNDRGFFVFNSGKRTTSAFNFYNEPKIYQRINALSPDAVMIMLGSNDWAVGDSPAVFKSRLQTMINSVRTSVSSVPDILLVQSYRRFDVIGSSYTWDEYGMALQQLTTNAGCYYLDISDFYPDSQAHDAADLISSDDVHQTDAGYSYMARLLYSSLT